MDTIQHFLLVFDHSCDELVQELHFGTDTQSATQRYNELEKQFRGDLTKDIVLIGSDSIETVKVTHANYFHGMSKRRLNDALDKMFA